jgi:uncharacterized protein YwgA
VFCTSIQFHNFSEPSYHITIQIKFKTLLEIHNLLYFIQIAGEPLRLKYKKAVYGPYAENLRHVLSLMNGHYISGYDDRVDSPDKPIEVINGSIAENRM